MAQSNRKTTPPQFKESMHYKLWKNKFQIWQLVISVPKNQQAIIFRLESLDNNAIAEKARDQLTAMELNDDDSREALLNT